MKNMMDMVGMIKKAQAVQTQMAAVQNKMENTEFTGLAANGAVEVVITGKFVPVKIKLDKSVVNPNDRNFGRFDYRCNEECKRSC